jgi:4'-phosphopantetheinyl transferase
MGSLLDPGEKIRAERLVIRERRSDFVLQRGILRFILSRYLARSPEEIQISTSADGKPYLPEGDIQFNISHSNDLMICGVTSEARIGVDIQLVYPIENIERIIPKILTPSEIELLDRITLDERIDLFYTIWTAKEAFLKAIGSGFQLPAKEINICSLEENTLTLEVEDPAYGSNWSIREMEIETGYKSVLALEGSKFYIEIITSTPENFPNEYTVSIGNGL